MSYTFDLEENRDAQVEFQALHREHEERAPAGLRTLWQTEVFGESAAVVYSSDKAATRERGLAERLPAGASRNSSNDALWRSAVGACRFGTGAFH